MNLVADMRRHAGRATPSLHDTPHQQIEEATGRRSAYLLPIAVQTNPATSLTPCMKRTLASVMFGAVMRRCSMR